MLLRKLVSKAIMELFANRTLSLRSPLGGVLLLILLLLVLLLVNPPPGVMTVYAEKSLQLLGTDGDQQHHHQNSHS